MASSTLERKQYWLEGASTVPFITRRKIVTTVSLVAGVIGLLSSVTLSQNPWAAGLALILALAAVVVWNKRDRAGRPLRWLRTTLARQGRWDEFDPDVETRPFWLSRLRVLAVSGDEAASSELVVLDEGRHLIAVLEVDGGGQAIQETTTHVRRERAFQDVLRAAAQSRSGVDQLDFVTRAAPAQDDDVATGELASWVTPAVATSMQELQSEAKARAQQVRSWIAIRMPVHDLEEKVRDQGLRPSDVTLAEAAFDTVGQVARLLGDHGIAVHRGLSARRLAAVIRGILLPSRSVDDTTGIRGFWDAWPAFAPTGRGDGLVVFDPDTDVAACYHASGCVPRRGWPTSAVYGRWLAPVVLTNRLEHRVVVSSFHLIPPVEAVALAKDQLTTAASLRIRERQQGRVLTGERDVAESSAHVVGQDVTVRSAAGVRTLVRLMVSSPTQRGLRRAKEEAMAIMSQDMGLTDFWWDE